MNKIMSFLDKRQTLVLLFLFIFSLGLKLALTYMDYSANGISNWGDAKYYLRLGNSFAEGDFYPEYKDLNSPLMVVGPAVPLLIAIMIRIFGNPIWPVLILNCILSALLVYVLFALGKRLLNVWAGYLLAIWSIFHFNIIMSNFQIVKEPFLLLLVPLLIFTLLSVNDRKKVWQNLVLSGLLFSLLIHTDERFTVFAPFIALFLVFSAGRGKRLANLLLWSLILLLTMIPWTIRNYRQYGEVVILSSRTTAFTSKFFGTKQTKIDFTSEEAISRMQKKESVKKAVELYGKEPRTYGRIERHFLNAWHFWKPAYFKFTYVHLGYYPMKWSLSHNLFSIAFYGIFLPFFLAGIVLALIRKEWLWLFLCSFPLSYGFVHHIMLIWPMERYRLPVDFLVVLIALWFIRGTMLSFNNHK